MGTFLIVHLLTTARAIQGPAAFQRGLAAPRELPYWIVFEIVCIGLPLIYHAIYGIKIAFEARPNVVAYPTGANYAYLLQRLTGLVALAFLVIHIGAFRIPIVLGTMTTEDAFPELCRALSSRVSGVPAVAIAYLVGVAASVYHLVVGLQGFCFSWGITGSRRASRLAAGVFALGGMALFVVGANTVTYFATGAPLLWDPRFDASDQTESCSGAAAEPLDSAAPSPFPASSVP